MPTYKITSQKLITFETVIEADSQNEAEEILLNECEFDLDTATNIQWNDEWEELEEEN